MATSTTVITSSQTQQWQTGLCDLCADGVGGFLYAFFCAGCAVASARTAYDGSNFCMNLCCASPALLRNIVREGYHIEGTCCNDICIAMCCPACSAIQIKGEVNKRGRNANTITVATTTVQPAPVMMQPGYAQPPPQQGYAQPPPPY